MPRTKVQSAKAVGNKKAKSAAATKNTRNTGKLPVKAQNCANKVQERKIIAGKHSLPQQKEADKRSKRPRFESDKSDSNNNATITSEPVVATAKSLINSIKRKRINHDKTEMAAKNTAK